MKKSILFPFAILFLLFSCQNTQNYQGEMADTVYVNGKIYTVNEAQPWAKAFAIKGKKIIKVGSTDDMKSVTGDSTETLDLEGGFVMPGFVDLHVHPFGTALFNLLNLDFSNNMSHESMMEELKAFAEEHPEKTWIRAGSYGIGVYPNENPRKEDLDNVVPDRPVICIDATGHNYWLNSKALELAGITKDTESKLGFVIEKDPDTGEPSGTVRELAIRVVEQVADWPSLEEWVEIEKKVMLEFVSNGITAMQTAEAADPYLDAIMEMEKNGEMPLRMFASWDWHMAQISAFTNEQMDEQIKGRAQYETELVNPNFVKIFADGAPTGYGCRFIEPYTNTDINGNTNLTQEEFKEVIAEFDRQGISCFIHTIGTGTTRWVLDGLEYTRNTNGNSDVRHKLSHLYWIHPDDISRFTSIPNIATDFSPGLLYYQPGLKGALEELLGPERADNMAPVKTLLETGARVGYGSDWLTIAPINPFPQLQAFITRENTDHPEFGIQNADNRITLEQALEIFTLGGAYAVDADDRIGSIEEGKLADMILLDKNLFEIDVTEIKDVNVLFTMMNGKIVYDYRIVGEFEEIHEGVNTDDGRYSRH